MNKLFFPLVFFLSFSAFGQSPTLDSMRQQIDARISKDTAYVDARLAYIRQVIMTAPSHSELLDYTLETLQQAQDIGYALGQMLSQQRLGVIYQYFLAQPLEALKYYQDAIVVIEANPNLKLYSPASLSNIATIYYEREEYEQALQVYRSMYQDFKRPGFIPEQYLGQVFGELNQLDSSIFYFEKAIEEAVKIKNPAIEANSLGNLSKILLQAGKLPEAVKAVGDGIKLVEQYNIALAMPAVYTNASMVYLASKDYDKAERYAKASLEIPGMRKQPLHTEGHTGCAL